MTDADSPQDVTAQYADWTVEQLEQKLDEISKTTVLTQLKLKDLQAQRKLVTDPGDRKLIDRDINQTGKQTRMLFNEGNVVHEILKQRSNRIVRHWEKELKGLELEHFNLLVEEFQSEIDNLNELLTNCRAQVLSEGVGRPEYLAARWQRYLVVRKQQVVRRKLIQRIGIALRGLQGNPLSELQEAKDELEKLKQVLSTQINACTRQKQEIQRIRKESISKRKLLTNLIRAMQPAIAPIDDEEAKLLLEQASREFRSENPYYLSIDEMSGLIDYLKRLLVDPKQAEE